MCNNWKLVWYINVFRKVIFFCFLKLLFCSLFDVGFILEFMIFFWGIGNIVVVWFLIFFCLFYVLLEDVLLIVKRFNVKGRYVLEFVRSFF